MALFPVISVISLYLLVVVFSVSLLNTELGYRRYLALSFCYHVFLGIGLILLVNYVVEFLLESAAVSDTETFRSKVQFGYSVFVGALFTFAPRVGTGFGEFIRGSRVPIEQIESDGWARIRLVYPVIVTLFGIVLVWISLKEQFYYLPLDIFAGVHVSTDVSPGNSVRLSATVSTVIGTGLVVLGLAKPTIILIDRFVVERWGA